jgi:hypothetical protein
MILKILLVKKTIQIYLNNILIVYIVYLKQKNLYFSS